MWEYMGTIHFFFLFFFWEMNFFSCFNMFRRRKTSFSDSFAVDNNKKVKNKQKTEEWGEFQLGRMKWELSRYSMKEQDSPLTKKLPRETFLYISSFLNPRDLWKMATTCSSIFQLILQSDSLWFLISFHFQNSPTPFKRNLLSQKNGVPPPPQMSGFLSFFSTSLRSLTFQRVHKQLRFELEILMGFSSS